MIRKFFAAVVFCLLLMPGLAGAADWLHFMEDSNGDVVYMDMESIDYTSEHTAKVATKTESKGAVVKSISTVELDCKTSLIRVTKGYKNSKDKNWHAVDPDGMDDLLMEFICSHKKAR